MTVGENLVSNGEGKAYFAFDFRAVGLAECFWEFIHYLKEMRVVKLMGCCGLQKFG